MSNHQKQSTADGPAETLAVAAGSAAWLRSDADSWEGLGKHLGFLDEEDAQRNAARVAGLRAAADEIDRLRAALTNLLDTSAVTESDEDFTTIQCVNKHYEAAYDLLPNSVVSHTGALPDSKISNQVTRPGVGL